MPVNDLVRKDNCTESYDLECQERHPDIIPTSSMHERKFSLSSCSLDGLISSKERFLLVYILQPDNTLCIWTTAYSKAVTGLELEAKPVLLMTDVRDHIAVVFLSSQKQAAWVDITFLFIPWCIYTSSLALAINQLESGLLSYSSQYN
jgi:hypothetical protein